jgi:hypothetical protein
MKRLRLFFSAAIVLSLLTTISCTSHAQFGRSKYTSPPAHAESTVAGDKIMIDYYAPSVHGRKIRSDGGNKGTVALDWEKTEAYIPLSVIR